MASRTAQIVIQVDDKSLIQLNAEIKALETSMKNLKIGTQEWIAQNQKLGELKTKFQDATLEAKKLQGQIAKISVEQQIKSVAKLGAGMVGAFSAVSGSLRLLGIESENIDEMTARATTLMNVMGGLNQLSETFNMTTVKGIKSLGAGFTSLVTTVKTASTAMRVALISTGIGALVVAVGLLIANWEKLKDLVLGTSRQEKRALEESNKQREIVIKGIDDQNKALEEQLRIMKIRDSYTTASRMSDNEGELQEIIDNQNKGLEEQIKIKKAQISLAEQEITKLLKKVDVQKLENKLNEESVEIEEKRFRLFGGAASAGEKAGEKYQKRKITQKESDYLVQKNIVDAGKLEIKNLEEQLRLNKEILDTRLKVEEQLKDETKRGNEKINILENDITLLKVRADTENSTFQKEKEILDIQIKQIDDFQAAGAKLNDDELKRLGNLVAQRKELILQNNLFNHQVKLARERYEEDLKYMRLQQEINVEVANLQLKYISVTEDNKKRADYTQNIIDEIENEIGFLTDAQKRYQTILKYNKEINDTKKQTVKDIEDQLKTELDYYTEIQNKNIERLEYERLIVENRISGNEDRKRELEETAEILRKQLSDTEQKITDTQIKLMSVAKDPYLGIAEKQQQTLELQGQINDLELETKSITAEILNTNNQITDATNETVRAKNEIVGINDEIYSIEEDIRIEAEKTTKEIEKQQKAYSKLQNFVKEYAKEIEVISQILNQSMELIATIFDSRADAIQRKIDDLNEQYSTLNEEEDARQAKLLEYENELKDANGTRYDELLDLIAQEKQDSDQNYISKEQQEANLKELEDQRKEEELKAARWRKAQGIIDATIQTALAVVKSLPNLFLAAAVGILGAAQIATIVAQNVQPYKIGGFTDKDSDDNKAVGVVHANEYVVPAKVVKSSKAQEHIAALERQRVKGYQDGGFVAPAITSGNDMMFDYNKLTNSLVQALSKMPNPQVALVSVSNGLRDVELTKQNAGLTR